MPEAAVYNFNILSTTGTGILLAAHRLRPAARLCPLRPGRMYGATASMVRFSLLTIACMLALGYVTRYSGTDATLGLAFAQTGWLYPFFGTMLGWLGVALTGSDTSSNVLFGGLQKVTAQQLGLNPVLMAAANSLGRRHGQDDRRAIDRRRLDRDQVVRPRRLDPALRVLPLLRARRLVGILVMAQAYVPPFTAHGAGRGAAVPAAN